ncbi:hypothetical protein ACKWWA_003719, partial [Enterobacter bugandensis]
TGNASAIYSRTRTSLLVIHFSEAMFIASEKNYWGFLSPQGGEKTLKTTTLLSFCFYLGRHKKTGHSPGFYV